MSVHQICESRRASASLCSCSWPGHICQDKQWDFAPDSWYLTPWHQDHGLQPDNNNDYTDKPGLLEGLMMLECKNIGLLKTVKLLTGWILKYLLLPQNAVPALSSPDSVAQHWSR